MYGTPGALIENDSTLTSTVPSAEVALIKIGDYPFVKTRDYDWGLSISAADAANVPNWLKLFNWIYASEANYNFCVYGVEGKDWQKNSDGSIQKLSSDSFWDAWFLEATMYTVFSQRIPAANITAYKNNDNGSVLAKDAGFVFDSSPVSTELALMTAVHKEFISPMILGLLDYTTNYDKAIQQLKNAGLDTYIAEYQKQFSVWYAANKK
jgi:putative aldouronate transport system substrate-binding protein